LSPYAYQPDVPLLPAILVEASPGRGYPSGRGGVDPNPNPVRQTPIRLFRRMWLDPGEG